MRNSRHIVLFALTLLTGVAIAQTIPTPQPALSTTVTAPAIGVPALTPPSVALPQANVPALIVQAVDSAHGSTAKHVALAALIAIGLKFVLDFLMSLMSLKNLTDSAKKWLPWACMGLGVVIGFATYLANGSSYIDAMILGCSGPLTVIVNELGKALRAKIVVPETDKNKNKTNGVGAVGCILPLAVLMALLALSACTGTIYDNGRQYLTGANLAVKGAATAFTSYDVQHQADLVIQAKAACKAAPDVILCQKAEGKILLDGWGVVYSKTKLAFDATNAGLGAAALAVDAAEAGKAGKPVLDTILAGVKGPLKDLVRVLVDVGLPPAVTTVLNSIVGG